MIKEDFLHYLWKYQLFDFSSLESTSNEKIQILTIGTHNHNAGPDFFNAKITIENQVWAGNVEIHIKSSDWFVHNHETDSAYDNVILHVVWDDDAKIFRKDNSVITTLVLKRYVKPEMISSYLALFSKKKSWINCSNDINFIDSFTFNNWLERLYFERLNKKSDFILQLLNQSNNDWESVLFKLLAKNFGLKVNGDSFFSLASSFNFSIFRKNQHDIKVLEALLFGQAALIDDQNDNFYANELQQEYSYLKQKYRLEAIHKSEIKFFRLRPNNFPTIRLSQLANLYFKHHNLFSKVIQINTIEEYYSLFKVNTSLYWETHYSFKSESKKQLKSTTKAFIDLVLINTIIPLKFVYLQRVGKLDNEKILKLIQQIKPENNTIIDGFKILKIESKSAMQTQSLLQLKNEYCNKNQCLQCVVGNALLKN